MDIQKTARVVREIVEQRRRIMDALRAALVAHDDARALAIARELTGLRD